MKSLRKWLTSRRKIGTTCRVVAILLGVPAACLVGFTAWFVSSTWHTPSLETRRLAIAYLRQCSLDPAELPAGWMIKRKDPYGPYFDDLPGRALGGIRVLFESRSPRPLSDGPTLLPKVTHEMLLLRSSRVASSTFRRLPAGHSSRFYLPLVEKDISQAEIAADKYSFGCSSWYVSTGDRRCKFKGRYDRLTSIVDASISYDRKALDALVQFIEAVDTKMVACVRDTNLPTGMQMRNGTKA